MTSYIRAATPEDVDAIFAVRTSVTENLLTLTQLTEMGITKASIARMIAESPCAWVAMEDGAVVGFSMINDESGSLFAAFVLPAHEGKGLGTALVRVAEDALFQRHHVIWLETGRRTRAAEFYRHLGWGSETEITAHDIRLEKLRS